MENKQPAKDFFKDFMRVVLAKLELEELDLSHVGLLILLRGYQEVLITWKDLEKWANCCERTLKERIRQLEEAQLVVRETDRRGVIIRFVPQVWDGKFCPGSDISSLSSLYSSLNLKSIDEVIEHLNSISKKKFRSSSKAYQKLIVAKLKDDYTVNDFKQVHLNCSSWVGDPKMDRYFRPQTLYSSKFDSYLNATPVMDKSKCTSSKWDTPEAQERAKAERERLINKMTRHEERQTS
jgi:uncharacterized phage protein (TIGR02220 family)